MMDSKDHLFFDKNYKKFYDEEKNQDKHTNKTITINSIVWRNNNKLPHREDNDKPAIIKRDGTLIWYHHGNFHRNSGKPSFVNHELQYLRWHHHGIEHRIGGFSSIHFNENGYILKVKGISCCYPDYYFKKCKEWINTQNYTSHDHMTLLEDLTHKMDIGYFLTKNWNEGIFTGNLSNEKMEKPQ